MRRGRRGSHSPLEFGGSGEDSFVAVVVTKLTGALLFILLLSLVIMALLPKAAEMPRGSETSAPASETLTITSPEQLPEAISGRPYRLALAASGGGGPRSWALDGELPDGLAFDPATATITGTPKAGTPRPVPLVARVTDGRSRDSRQLLLTIYRPDGPLSLPSPLSRHITGPAVARWLEQGFGFVLLWLIHFLGMSVLGRLERRAIAWTSDGQGAAPIGRFTAYRWVLRVATLASALALAGWLWGRMGF
jgi:hypothetical protein